MVHKETLRMGGVDVNEVGRIRGKERRERKYIQNRGIIRLASYRPQTPD